VGETGSSVRVGGSASVVGTRAGGSAGVGTGSGVGTTSSSSVTTGGGGGGGGGVVVVVRTTMVALTGSGSDEDGTRDEEDGLRNEVGAGGALPEPPHPAVPRTRATAGTTTLHR
jgi:hypothetical protein